MVCEWGMSDEVGPLNFSGGNQEVFLGRDYARPNRTYSENTAQQIDEEIRTIVKSRSALARKLLVDNMQLLRDLAEALLEFDKNTEIRDLGHIRTRRSFLRVICSAP